MATTSLDDSIAKLLKGLPASPGCYIFKDESGAVLYVGKAVKLRSRVRSYFQGSTRHGPRIARLVRKVRDIEWIVVDSEVEALVLECNLIKRHRPPFNVLMRDDKSYPYIMITKERFPRVLFTRRVRKDGSRYFGPFVSAYAVRDTLKLLHKVFPLIPCGKSWSGADVQRPCLYYHLGQCMAPCAGLSDEEDYGRVLNNVEQFLSGREETLLDALRHEMDEASAHENFEEAGRIRDRLVAIETVLNRQKVVSGHDVDQDVVAVVKDERGAAIQMLYIRGGKLIGQRQFVLDGAADAAPSELVQQFIKQYYADAGFVPREVLLPVEFEERQIVQTWLRQRKGSAVTVEVPQQGEKAKLIDLAASNAEQALSMFAQEMQQKEAWAETAIEHLQDQLGLPTPPARIEGYDISNVQGTAPVGSMVVCENGEAARAEYRRFKIRYHPESPNDFAMMHEVITRRFKAFLDGDAKFLKLPDLVMIDGGKGQLSAALKARDELGLTMPMIGLAKRHELIYVPDHVIGEAQDAARVFSEEYSYERAAPKLYAYRDVELPLNSPGLTMLRRLRDEAHRFALTYHRKLRDRRMHGSSIEEIPGIGPRRKRLLLRTFGSIEAIRRSSIEEIASVPTMTKTLAERILEHLREE